MKPKAFKELLKSIDWLKSQRKPDLFDSKSAKLLWKKADDAKRTGMMMSEIYSNVPKKFRNIYVSILEFQLFKTDKKTKAELMKWLNKD